MAKKLLIVDDDPALLGLLNLDLPKQGYEVQSAASGDEALALAGKTRFDAVLLDVMMPGTDGYHVALELTKNQGVA